MSLPLPPLDLARLLSDRNFVEIKATLASLPLADSAEAMEELPPAEQAVLFRLLPTDKAAELFEYLPIEAQEKLLHAMGNTEAAKILDAMAADDRTALLEELPTQVCARLVDFLSPSERAIALKLLDYPEDSIGRLMTSEYVAIRDTWTVSQVLDHIRRNGRDRETLNVLYVVDPNGKLLDAIRIREFLLCPLDKKVSELRGGVVTSLHATDDQETAVEAFRKYDRTVLPVVDGLGGIVGIVTVDDVLDVAEEEATEDIQKIGGMEHLDEPYMDISLGRLIKKRATWLAVLFVGEFLTSTVMSHYYKAEGAHSMLTIFLPLIISSGGNSGSQATTLIIRAMGIREVGLADWWRVMRREIISGFVLGLILATIGIARIGIWSLFSDQYGPHWERLAATIGVALVGVVMWGTLAGSMLPFLLRRLGLDPATSSAPLVATLVDVTGIIIYFAVAGVIMQGL